MIHQSLQLKKKRITYIGCEDQKRKKERRESTKILMEKKGKKP
jgi:hypothetical protein